MINRMNFHYECSFCGKNGLIFSHFNQSSNNIETKITIDKRHEGWPGIPHGGVAMTSMIEIADLLNTITDNYPIRAHFRFGGDKIVLGDEVLLSVTSDNEKYKGEITKISGNHPYLKCYLEHNASDEYEEEILSIKDLLNKPVKCRNLLAVPDHAHKIIFRKEFHTIRKHKVFEFRELQDGRIVLLNYFREDSDSSPVYQMSRISKHEVHPGVLITILDETLGWSGFLSAWQGGVTVDLLTYFIRPVEPEETILSIGICDKIYGTYHRKMTICSGGIFSIRGEDLEPLVYSRGKWLTKPEYKEKMVNYLLKSNDSFESDTIGNYHD